MRPRHRIARVLLCAALLVPAASHALAPALLLMIKQIVRQSAQSMVKDALLSSLDGLGCKGVALSNALAAFELRKGGGAAPMALGGLPPEAAAMMAQMTARMPPGMAPPTGVPMGAPLSARETVATIDELAELGFLPKPMQIELKQCMTLVPAALPALGMGLGMLKPIVPQLRQARAELHAMSPAEQDEVAAAFAQEARALTPAERTAFAEHLDSGFFPPRIAAAVQRHFSSTR